MNFNYIFLHTSHFIFVLVHVPLSFGLPIQIAPPYKSNWLSFKENIFTRSNLIIYFNRSSVLLDVVPSMIFFVNFRETTGIIDNFFWAIMDDRKTSSWFSNDGDGKVHLFFCVSPIFTVISFDYTVVGCIVAENNYDECYCDDAVKAFARQNILVGKNFWYGIRR